MSPDLATNQYWVHTKILQGQDLKDCSQWNIFFPGRQVNREVEIKQNPWLNYCWCPTQVFQRTANLQKQKPIRDRQTHPQWCHWRKKYVVCNSSYHPCIIKSTAGQVEINYFFVLHNQYTLFRAQTKICYFLHVRITSCLQML